MGTKAKFWYQDEDDTSWLFKFARSSTGEHWSEKIAAEIGAALGVPCAQVELALCDGHPGSVSRSFVEAGEGPLVHGNELLQEVDESYPTVQLRGVSKHTVDAVLGRLEGVRSPRAGDPALICAADWFVGYLLLDAVIVNSDRHHENWGVLQLASNTRQLAPSYDHASSLGRELKDAERLRRLATSDPAFAVDGYVQRARSGFYAEVEAVRPLHPTDAFRLAGDRRPTAMEVWLAQLRQTSEGVFERIVARVPDTMISAPERAFALAVLRAARQHLLGPIHQAPYPRS
jgi:HipA-like C-terminal domain